MKFIAIGVLLIISTVLFGQKDFEGEIIYGIEYIEVPEDVAGMEYMLPQEMKILVSDPYVRIEQETMGGSQVIVSDTKNQNGFILMDMMGQKLAMEISQEEILAAEEEEANEDVQFEHTGETKKILGYTCEKVIVSSNGQTMIVWYTKELKRLENYASQGNFKGLEGMPLSYETAENGMQMRLTVTNMEEKELGIELFEIPDGFMKMSMDEMQGMFGK